jgi:hypothetical protein
MDEEVGDSIINYLSKLETLYASIYGKINVDRTRMTEEMVIIILRRLPILIR